MAAKSSEALPSDMEKGDAASKPALKPAAKPKPRQYSTPEMAILVSIFMLSGPLLIMSNKYILRDVGFQYPLTLSCVTLCFSSLACQAYVTVYNVQLRHSSMVTREFYLYRICPIGALSAGTIVLGMASYLYLTVAFVQMLKAFTPVMTLTGLVLFGLTRPSMRVVVCVLVICLGTAIAGAGELNFSLVGMCCMLLAQACEALKLIFTQVVLQNLRFDLVETLYYVTPTSAAFVFVFALLLEVPHMTADDVALAYANSWPFLFSCAAGLSTNVINTFVIQFSNALVLKLVATARNALLVLVNAMLLGEVVTATQFFGYFISLGGFCAYNYVKYKEA